MGRFARNSQTTGAGRNPARVTAGRQFAVQARNSRAPTELKYFVLALAALVGLGVGWVSGKAITGWLPAASPPLAVAERAAPPTPEATPDRSPTARPELNSEAATPQAAVPDDAAWQDSSPPADTVAQAAVVDSESRAERRVARRAHLRRQARGSFFFRPFKALRRLRIW